MAAFLSTQPVVLASGSVTRRRMLEAAGVEVVTQPAPVDEEEVKLACRADGFTADQVAEALAELKAMRVGRTLRDVLVIGADQMLECEGQWFDKPVGRDGARDQLAALSGRTHRLVSCVVVVHNGQRVWHHTDAARMAMRPLSGAFIERYLDAAGEAVHGSVGGYQLEGLGAQLFARVQGDHFTVLGLPLLPLLDYLRTRGVLPG